MSQYGSVCEMGDVEDLDATPVEIKTANFVQPIVDRVYVIPPPYAPPAGAPPAGPASPRMGPASPRAGESFIQQPPSLLGIVNQWMAWDAKEQQMIRQNCGVDAGTRGVYTPATTFAPKQLPQLTPIADPKGLEEQIQNILVKFNGVSFADEDIASRKAFLGRVEKQGADLMAKTARQCALWNRQQIEYKSLAEYDAEVMRLRAEQKIAMAMGGGRKKAQDL